MEILKWIWIILGYLFIFLGKKCDNSYGYLLAITFFGASLLI
jgi:hypothetical protein